MPYIDPVQVSPDVYRVIEENETTRMLEMKLAPGKSDRLHSHPDEAVYFVKGGKAKIQLEDGKEMEAELPDGAAMMHEGWTHRVTNTGSTTILAVIVERKK